MAFGPVVITDVKGAMDTAAQMVNLASHFSDGQGTVMYEVASTSMYLDTSVTDGVLSVALMGMNVPYSNQMVSVTASDGVDTVKESIMVRRNRKPVVAGTDDFAAVPVTVGTQYPNDSATCAIGTNITDDDDDKVTYVGVTSQGKDAASVMIDPADTGVMVTGLKSTFGTDFTPTILIDVTGTDSGGEAVIARGACAVRVDAAPKEADPPLLRDVVLKLSGTNSVDLAHANAFTDAENETLTITAKSNDNSVATASADGTNVTINAIGAGSTTVTVTATEAPGTNPSTDPTVVDHIDQDTTATIIVTVLAD